MVLMHRKIPRERSGIPVFSWPPHGRKHVSRSGAGHIVEANFGCGSKREGVGSRSFSCHESNSWNLAQGVGLKAKFMTECLSQRNEKVINGRAMVFGESPNELARELDLLIVAKQDDIRNSVLERLCPLTF